MKLRMALVLLAVATSGVVLAATATSWGPAEETSKLSASPPEQTGPSLPLSPTPDLDADAVDARRTDARGEPARVVIPAIDVDADLVGVGLETDGSMEVPDFGLAGWYTEGPRPGLSGPSVIVAHVDSRAGPDIFHRLGDLVPGDQVHVIYDSGDQVTFLVDSSEQTSKDELPADAIWPTTSDPLLTLITCGGKFDHDVGHYRDNLIVYASPGIPDDQSLR